MNFLESSPVKCTDIRDHTRRDPVLASVLRYYELGWPSALKPKDADLLPYFRKRDELSIEGGCLLWGSRVVIPLRVRKPLLAEVHSGHVGASRMKELARSYLWWPNLDSDLEELVKHCPECLETRNAPPKAELHPWEWPNFPWHFTPLRLHLLSFFLA